MYKMVSSPLNSVTPSKFGLNLKNVSNRVYFLLFFRKAKVIKAPARF